MKLVNIATQVIWTSKAGNCFKCKLSKASHSLNFLQQTSIGSVHRQINDVIEAILIRSLLLLFWRGGDQNILKILI